MKQLLLILSAITISLSIYSQQGKRAQVSLSGKITDGITGLPLQGASISIDDAKRGTKTDSLGNYLLENLPAGHHVIEVSFTGYGSIVMHLDINGKQHKDFIMFPAVVENQGVVVTGVSSATSIRKAAVPLQTVRHAELLQTSSTNIIDALARKPGISQLQTGPGISKPVIRGLGYNRVVVVNDGVRQEGQQWGDEH